MRFSVAILLCAGSLISIEMGAGLAVAEETVTSATPTALSVTIYRDNLAMVREQRSLDLGLDTRSIEFAGVSTGIVPESASVLGLTGTERERNFDYNLLTPGALIRDAVGREIRLTRTLPGSGKVVEDVARVISAESGLVLSINGKHEAFSCSGLPERLSFDAGQQDLRRTPTLSTRFIPQAAGQMDLTLNYLTSSLSWAANYVATIAEDGRSLSLRGMITLTNSGSVALKDAEVFAIAGTLNRSSDQHFGNWTPDWFSQCWPSAEFMGEHPSDSVQKLAGAAYAPPAPAALAVVAEADMMMATAEKFADYQLYKLPGRTTVEAFQSKQVAYLLKDKVEFDQIYRFRFTQIEFQSADDVYPHPVMKFDNSRKTGLGEPLASGNVRFIANGSDGPLPLGETSLKDIPVGEKFELSLPPITTVRSESAVINKQPDGKGMELTIRHIIHNGKSTAITVEIDQTLPDGQPEKKLTFRASSSKPVQAGENWRRWQLKIPQNGQKTLTYKVFRPY